MKKIYLLILVTIGALFGQPISRSWKGLLSWPGATVTFGLEFQARGKDLTGFLMNAGEKLDIPEVQFDGKNFKFNWPLYDCDITGTYQNNKFEGKFTKRRRTYKLNIPFQAEPGNWDYQSNTPSGKNISGEWNFLVGNQNGKEDSWYVKFDRTGTRTVAVVIPPDGDLGKLEGTMTQNQLALSRFDGIHILFMKGQLDDSGTLTGIFYSNNIDSSAFRAKRANAKDTFPPLRNPYSITRPKDPGKPFEFSFPDPDGKIVSATDKQFQGKVLIVTIMGSWCPNCYDEEPVLLDLYHRYQSRGLEIIPFAFEFSDLFSEASRQIKSFKEKYHIPYTILIAGSTGDDVSQKIANLQNFNGYPTTIFVGRDRRIRKIHTGFYGPATGEKFEKTRQEFESIVKELLAEPAP